jgi:hypothetical protein
MNDIDPLPFDRETLDKRAIFAAFHSSASSLECVSCVREREPNSVVFDDELV